MLKRILKPHQVRLFSDSFNKRGSALEEEFIHRHEKEVLKEYQKAHPEIFKKAVRGTRLHSPTKHHSDKQAETQNSNIGFSPSGGVLGTREAALENQWIRKHDQELIDALKKKSK